MEDRGFPLEQLYLGVYIASDDRNELGMFARMFVQAGCYQATSLASADLVVFTGGEDVNPSLYNMTPHPTSYWDEERDEAEKKLFEECVELGIPMVGICRGAQFGHVMLGGKLYQHVDGHNTGHSMIDVSTGHVIEEISSVHHQMVMSNVTGGMEIIGVSQESTKKWMNDKQFVLSEDGNRDIEAFFYRDVCFLGFQGHPEYSGYDEYTDWCIKQIHHYVNENPDLEYRDKVQRMKKDLVAGRNLKELV